MFNEIPMSVSLQAFQDTEAAILLKDDFLNLVSRYPCIMANIIVELRNHFRSATRMISILTTYEAETKIAKTILWCHALLGDELCLTHQDIADMAGVTRETVSRSMAKLKREGVLVSEENGFRIVNEMRLDLLAR